MPTSRTSGAMNSSRFVLRPHDYELARESLFRASSRLVVTSNHVGAWIREVTHFLGADGLPGMDEIPEELQRYGMTIDYHAAMQYPFLSDTRCTESTSNDELQELLDILGVVLPATNSRLPLLLELELARGG
ncbi:hypothetical protein B0H14DRAFT_3492202 [Mycena olivaceomarginata]|nr:hypothetical protein B0H14DRAFT_3492202 [Mycena olivaceomarginata]